MTGPWQPTTLRDLLKIEHGYAFKGEYFSESGHYVLLTPGNFYEKGGFKLRPGKDRFYVGEIPDRYILPEGSMIVAMTEQAEGLLGSPALMPESGRYLHNQRLGRVRAVECRADLRFLYYLFNTNLVRQQLRNSSSGAKVRHTSPERIYRARVIVPEPATQRKIAAVLAAYDDLIETNKRRIALLEKMAEELYREWFVRMRFPGHQNTKFVKGVPEDWGESQLGKIARFTMGQSPKSEFYNEIGEGLPFHQGVGTYGDRFPNTVTYCSINGRRADKGDILFSVRAPVGRLNIADREMIIGRGLAAIRHVEGQNAYLYYLLKIVFANEDMIGNGAIFNSVGKAELSRFGVHRHPKSLVSKFEDFARPIDKQIENLTLATSALTKSRDLLLPRLISGKLPVEDVDIQFPASMREEA